MLQQETDGTGISKLLKCCSVEGLPDHRVCVLNSHKTYNLSHSISGLLDGVSRIPKYTSLFAGGGVLVGLPTPESGLGAGRVSAAYFSSF